MIHICYSRLISDLLSESWQFSDASQFTLLAMLENLDPQSFFNLPKAPPRSGRFENVELNESGTRAVLNINGPLYKKVDPVLASFFGIGDLASVNRDIDELTADRNIRHVTLNIDSPGGLAGASTETASRIEEMASRKDRTVAYTDGVLGSAAYKLAVPADEIYASSDARVGSVGTYLALVDDSKKWEKEGRKLELLTDGGFMKAAGHPGTSLSAEQREFLQQGVAQDSEKFKNFVRENRPNISDSALQGQTLSGKRAVTSGLIDGHHRDLASLLAAEITR